MERPRVEKVVCYVVHEGRLLVFWSMGMPAG